MQDINRRKKKPWTIYKRVDGLNGDVLTPNEQWPLDNNNTTLTQGSAKGLYANYTVNGGGPLRT